MAWVRLDDGILDDEWFITVLTLQERYVWLALLVHSAKDRGCIKTDSLPMLARRIDAPVSDVTDLCEKAIQSNKIERIDGGLIFVNFNRYNADPRNAERQKRFRENKTSVKLTEDEPVTDVTGVTDVTLLLQSNATKDKEKAKTKTQSKTKAKEEESDASFETPMLELVEDIRVLCGVKKKSDDWSQIAKSVMWACKQTDVETLRTRVWGALKEQKEINPQSNMMACFHHHMKPFKPERPKPQEPKPMADILKGVLNR